MQVRGERGHDGGGVTEGKIKALVFIGYIRYKCAFSIYESPKRFSHSALQFITASLVLQDFLPSVNLKNIFFPVSYLIPRQISFYEFDSV